MREKLRSEMAKIAQKTAFEKLNLNQKIRKEGKVGASEVDQEVANILAKNNTSSFKTPDRENVQYAVRNKTNPPDVGLYTPRYENVDSQKF